MKQPEGKPTHTHRGNPCYVLETKVRARKPKSMWEEPIDPREESLIVIPMRVKGQNTDRWCKRWVKATRVLPC